MVKSKKTVGLIGLGHWGKNIRKGEDDVEVGDG